MASLDLPPGARPFFVSAGPDAAVGFLDINNNSNWDPSVDKPGGDDNLYSFEK
jgi:hypothetical protein